jgi:multisite-specific tRNA:(cytosine-C5)-methyltransferase
MTTPKNVVRRFPPFASFQKFLVSETSVGNISRQEIVSMIPPLLMDIKPGMTVLDLCAAPGSKTAQLIEMVHRGEEARVRKVLRNIFSQEGRELSPDGFEIEVEMEDAEAAGDWSDDGRSTGLVIANDADFKRAYMLVHQTKRLNSPNLIVTNHDATLFPSIRLPSPATLPGERPKSKYLKFDRILADVPCSGDGTCRKNPNVWKDWTPQNALGLHNTQVRILVRGLQMLKVGGRIVYSTCSMNPVENEAVIASAIDRCGGPSKVHIVDCSNELPSLKRTPGLTSWNVMDKKGRVWGSWKAVQDEIAQVGIEYMGRLAEDMFPPESVAKKEGIETERVPLERCMRVYGHFQDTGGFFITVLEKQTEIKARPESEQKKSVPKTPVAAGAEEIVEQPIDGTTIAKELDTLNETGPPIPLPTANPPVGSQNQANYSPELATPAKRAQDDGFDPMGLSKRPRLGEESKPIAPDGEENGVLEPVRPVATQPSKAKRNGQPTEEPFKYISHDHEELEVIYDFYKLSDKFPRDRFMVRNASGIPTKTIYYTSALARDILTQNEGKGVRFVHCGVKMFMKQEVQREGTCKWRIQTDGCPIVEPWIGEGRIVRLYKRQTLRKLLKEMFPKVNGGGWEQLGEIGERVRDIEMGCCVLRVETSDAEDGFR